MPVIKSAIERVKTNRKAEARNAAQLSKYRTAVKKFEKANLDGSKDAKDLYIQAISAIDHAKSKGLIKANKAARDKSRLTLKLANK